MKKTIKPKRTFLTVSLFILISISICSIVLHYSGKSNRISNQKVKKYKHLSLCLNNNEYAFNAIELGDSSLSDIKEQDLRVISNNVELNSIFSDLQLALEEKPFICYFYTESLQSNYRQIHALTNENIKAISTYSYHKKANGFLHEFYLKNQFNRFEKIHALTGLTRSAYCDDLNNLSKLSLSNMSTKISLSIVINENKPTTRSLTCKRELDCLIDEYKKNLVAQVK